MTALGGAAGHVFGGIDGIDAATGRQASAAPPISFLLELPGVAVLRFQRPEDRDDAHARLCATARGEASNIEQYADVEVLTSPAAIAAAKDGSVALSRCGVGTLFVTPFVLARVNELTRGAAVRSNVALVENNARVGADVAVALVEEAAARGEDPSLNLST